MHHDLTSGAFLRDRLWLQGAAAVRGTPGLVRVRAGGRRLVTYVGVPGNRVVVLVTCLFNLG